MILLFFREVLHLPYKENIHDIMTHKQCKKTNIAKLIKFNGNEWNKGIRKKMKYTNSPPPPPPIFSFFYNSWACSIKVFILQFNKIWKEIVVAAFKNFIVVVLFSKWQITLYRVNCLDKMGISKYVDISFFLSFFLFLSLFFLIFFILFLLWYSYSYYHWPSYMHHSLSWPISLVIFY